MAQGGATQVILAPEQPGVSGGEALSRGGGVLAPASESDHGLASLCAGWDRGPDRGHACPGAAEEREREREIEREREDEEGEEGEEGGREAEEQEVEERERKERRLGSGSRANNLYTAAAVRVPE